MPYDGKILARARAELERIKDANRSEQRDRQLRVYTLIPEIEHIDAELRRQMAELVRLTISKRTDLQEQISALRESNLALQRRKAKLLSSAGLPEDYLGEIYSCPLCSDTGIAKDGGVCVCLDRLYNAELTKELGTLMRRGDESFERFDLSLYPSEYDPSIGAKPRDIMAVTFGTCQRFAENFSPASQNLLLQGGTGLGKTFLSACIARSVASRGFSVCYDSAAAALENYERAKFSRDIAESESASMRVRRMQDCDLMILDDLGTEMPTPMSQSALYTLLNSRLVSGKKTIISTNLTNDELARRYTPQTASRILGEFLALPFCGRDIRRMKK